MNNIVKIGTVEMTEDEAWEIYENDKYIVTYSKIYQVFYSQAQKCLYGHVIYRSKGLSKRGRYHVFDGKYINELVGEKIVIE